MFVASTALLPSTFAMYTMTAAAAAVLAKLPIIAEGCAALGIVWAWPVTAIGFLPFAVYVLLSAQLLASVGAAIALLIVTLLPLITADKIFYGQWTVREFTPAEHIIPIMHSSQDSRPETSAMPCGQHANGILQGPRQ